MRRIILSFTLFLATTAGASGRVYMGGYGAAWHTTGGHHGHDVDCPPDQRHDRCESSDFARANLDNSIGFRIGAEQRRSWLPRVDLVYGAELGIDSTEYNVSQRDLSFASGVATAGAVTDFFHVTWGLRAGAGLSASDDGHAGGTILAEASADVPLAGGVALRIAHRERALLLSGESLRLRDTAFLIVFAEAAAASRWSFGADVGISSPGLLFGDDHDLSRAPFTRSTAARRISDRSAVGVNYLTSAHESTQKTVFMGFPENERGKTIIGVGVDWTATLLTTPRYYVELGAGIEVADWADEHQLLPVSGGIEVAPALALTAGIPLTPRLALVVTSEHLYWSGIGLGESRLSIGLASR
ncbi:MAG TPA: hypothetical protein VHL59_02350 [Thermoanaerobaculia bacterium]|nr:hypothetical protein [Thermoanaerobaculia bacterium]